MASHLRGAFSIVLATLLVALLTPMTFLSLLSATPAWADEAPVPCPMTEASSRQVSESTPVQPSQPPIKQTAEPIGGPRMTGDGLLLPKEQQLPPSVTTRLASHSWIVADLDSGAVVAACAPHVRYAPASTLKLLNVLTVLPKLTPNQQITVTADDLKFEAGSSAVGLVEGGTYSAQTLLLGLLLVSGNDAANVLARVAGGSRGVAGTLKDMNAMAAKLNALDTHAVTPSGLDGKGQATSAYDLALIARALFARKDFSQYTSTERADIPAQQNYPAFQIQNDNALLTNYPGALGGKTGFTDLARHTYMGAAEQNGRRLVVTMLDGENRPYPLWRQASALLDWAFALPSDTKGVGQLVRPKATVTDKQHVPASPSAQNKAAMAVARRHSAATMAIIIGAMMVVGLLFVAWRGLRKPGPKNAENPPKNPTSEQKATATAGAAPPPPPSS